MFDILVQVTMCSAAAIKHFRKNDIGTATTLMSWSRIRGQFTEVLDDISQRTDHLRDMAQAENNRHIRNQSRLVEQLTRLSLLGSQNNSQGPTLPCHSLPYPRNTAFYGRSTILSSLDELFVDHDGVAVKNVALWGLGGIGKSQIALEFAYRQLAAGCQIILWISSEGDSEMASSFNRAASQLRVPGLNPSNTPDLNRFLVLQYLQSIGESRLIVRESSFWIVNQY